MSHFNRLKWGEIPWLRSVEIERKIDKGQFEKIATVEPFPNEFEDGDVELGKAYTYKVKYVGENFFLYSNEVYKKLPDSLRVIKNKIKRFTPIYWTAIAGQHTSCAVTSNDENSMKLTMTSRTDRGMAQLNWDTLDTRDHSGFTYEESALYSDVTLKFRLSISGDIPDLTDEQRGIVMLVWHKNNNVPEIIFLRNYATAVSGVPKTYDVELDFNTIKTGFNGTESFNNNNIDSVLFSVVTNSFSGENDGEIGIGEFNALPVAEYGTVTFSNVAISGSNSNLEIGAVGVFGNSLGVTTEYEMIWDLNPKRVVANLKALNYTGQIYHDCGSYRYVELSFNGSDFVNTDPLIDATPALNQPARDWHDAFARDLKSNNFNPIFAIPMEIDGRIARQDWAQKSFDGTLARTNELDPKIVLSPTNENVRQFLRKAFENFADFLYNNGLPIKLSIVNPRWLKLEQSNDPCVYDESTLSKFTLETDRVAIDLGDIYQALDKNDDDSKVFKPWLATTLGRFCQEIKQHVNSKYLTSQVSPSLYIADIFTDNASILSQINYPTTELASPNFDFVVLNSFGWIKGVNTQLTKSKDQVPVVISKLLYNRSKTVYLGGYVPDKTVADFEGFKPETPYASEIWKRIFGDIKNQHENAIDRFMISSYTQIMASSLTFTDNLSFGYYLSGEYFEPYTDDVRPYPDYILR